jgi:inorganic triphosphatase YgiF
MGQEIELKLGIDPGDIESLPRHPLVTRYADGPPVKKHLVNHYFDTPERLLRSHAMSIRIRFNGRDYIQTLKQKGISRDGLTVRGEWEWPVEGFHVRPDLIPEDILPAVVRNRLDRLSPVFRTDFYRTLWTLRIPGDNPFDLGEASVVELVLDQGAVSPCGERSHLRDDILEVELEILEGAPGILYGISDLLKESIRVVPCDISKAHRGYRLLDST